MVEVLLLAQLHTVRAAVLLEPAEALGAMVVEAVLTDLEVVEQADMLVVVVNQVAVAGLPQIQPILYHNLEVVVAVVVVERVKLLGLVQAAA
jgi:hypothetical protein